MLGKHSLHHDVRVWHKVILKWGLLRKKSFKGMPEIAQVLVVIKFGSACIMFLFLFSYGPGDQGSIPGWVIPKIQKMILDTSLLNTQHYKVRIKDKWNNRGKGVAPSPTPQRRSYWSDNWLIYKSSTGTS